MNPYIQHMTLKKRLKGSEKRYKVSEMLLLIKLEEKYKQWDVYGLQYS